MNKKFLRIIILILSFTVLNRLFAQCNDPIPKMFVEKVTAAERTLEYSDNRLFHTSKHARIKKNNIINLKPFNFIYTWNAMNDLIINKVKKDSIRVYFARFKAPCADFPDIADKSIILLFADEGPNPPTYYLITNDDVAHPIKSCDASKWIINFNDINQPELRKTISKKDADNHVNSNLSQEFSDTKSILYERKNLLVAFINEKTHQSTYHNIDLAAFGVNLSAYTKKGKKQTTDDPHTDKKRLFVQFEYLKNTLHGFEPFYLDDQKEDYNCRLGKNIALYKKNVDLAGYESFSTKQLEQKRSLDNGQLCPTKCN